MDKKSKRKQNDFKLKTKLTYNFKSTPYRDFTVVEQNKKSMHNF